MADLLIHDLKPETIAYWEERARRNGRSLGDEIAAFLSEWEMEDATASINARSTSVADGGSDNGQAETWVEDQDLPPSEPA